MVIICYFDVFSLTLNSAGKIVKDKLSRLKTDKKVCASCEKHGTTNIVEELLKQRDSVDIKQNKHSKHVRQIKEFIDKDHDVQMQYYEILESDISDVQMLKKMQTLIKKDQEFLDPYLVAADILFDMEKYNEAKAMLKEAYERALCIIIDSKGRWPKEMLWAFLENRHIMRAIDQYGLFCWEEGRIEEALDIFRKLLKVNPNDNQGARYNILAIRMGLDFDTWKEPFYVEEKSRILGLDAKKVWEWFDTNAPKYKDDFDWLLDFYKNLE